MTEEDRRNTIRRKLACAEIRRPAPPISTGFRVLDAVLGVGGLPRGRIVEWFGPPSCGKTTLALQTAAHVQRSGLVAAWIDADRTFDPGYAAALGVALDRLPVVRPESTEEAMEMVRQLLESRGVDLLVLDSAAALTPSLELGSGLSDSIVSLQGRVMASGLRKLCVPLRRSEAAAVFLNQDRGRIDGAGETSAGGPALKLCAPVRLALEAGNRPGLRLRALRNHAAAAFESGVLAWRKEGGFTDPL